jgi:hypothetical protein
MSAARSELTGRIREPRFQARQRPELAPCSLELLSEWVELLGKRNQTYGNRPEEPEQSGSTDEKVCLRQTLTHRH